MRRLGAEVAREREPPRAATDDEDARSVAAHHLEGQEPERPSSDDGHGLAGTNAAPADGADDDREGLGEDQVLVGDGGGRPPATARRDAHELGEAAIHVDPDRGARHADVSVALPSPRTRPARAVWRDRAKFAGRL